MNKIIDIKSIKDLLSGNDIIFPDKINMGNAFSSREAIIADIFNSISLIDDDSLIYIQSFISAKSTNRENSEENLPVRYKFKGKYKNPPPSAPVCWPKGHNTPERIVDFLNRVYGEWLGFGMTRADLEKIDDSAYYALRTWERKHGKWVSLPTVYEHNDALFEWMRGKDDSEIAEALPQREIGRLKKLSIIRKKKPSL